MANGDRLPSDDNLIGVIAWWERREHGPDEFHLGLHAEVYEESSPQELAQVSVLEPVERCAFLWGLGAFAGLGAASAIRGPWERLSLALCRPGSVDEKTAASLEPWRDSQAVSRLDKPPRAAGAALVHLR